MKTSLQKKRLPSVMAGLRNIICCAIVLVLCLSGTALAELLQYGSEGDAVAALQSRLAQLGYYTGSVDGTFDSETKEAVKLFQRANSLYADGIVGSGTRGVLASSDCVTLEQYNASVPLAKGDKGEAVKVVQRQLTNLGYYTGEISGTFDTALYNAVKAFQTANSLKVSGKATTETRLLLNSGSAISQTEYERIRPLKSGDKGEAVKLVQAQLSVMGYYTSEVDGKYGSLLTAAVKEFQTANQLSVTGKADTATRTLLNSGKGLTAAQYDLVRPLKSGNKGDAVKQVQTQLTQLGYYSETIDGKFDSGVVSAVKEFQTANRLDDTGKADVATRKLLNAGSGVTAAEYDKVRPLKSGNKGDAVKQVQTQLAQLGYYTETIDGKFGSDVVGAVKEFQKANGMAADGKATVEVRTLLNAGSGVKAEDYYKVCSIKSGSPAGAVKILQKQLTELEYYDEVPDGKYGTAVKEAVKSFQRANGLKVTGNADEKTHALMNDPSCVTGATYNLTCELKSGSQGVAVKVLQRRLTELGYYTDSIDGKFDSALRNIVKVFQVANGLKETGTADEQTRIIMNGDSAVTAEQYEKVRPLRSGDRGDAVKQVQTQLTQLGYYSETIDGKFDSGLRDALEEFQTANQLSVTGKADVATRKLLNAGSGVTAAEYEKVRPLRSGDRGDAVKQVQTQLAQLGYYTETIDGKFGSDVVGAVKEFQKANGMAADGKATVEVRTLLNAGSGVKAEDYYKVCSIKSGSPAGAVKILQKQLTELEYYDGAQDGKYGTAVKEAVKSFQRANGLKVTGNADEKTHALMNDPSCVTGATYNLTCELKSGSQGVAVKVLQRRLTELGYYTDIIDGKFDSALRNIVKVFQVANGLKETGTADEQTRIIMNGDSAVTAEQYEKVRPLRSGDRGDAVKQVQTQLTLLGYYSETIDGKFDSGLRDALEEFQTANGLDDTGKADVATRKLLNAGNGVTLEEYNLIRPLKSGDRGEAVTMLQVRLAQLGYYVDGVDGKFDSAVKDAVKVFQSANGLSVTGKADVVTRTLMNEEQAVSREQYDADRDLAKGDWGSTVYALELRLNVLGYTNKVADGKYDSDTRTTVRLFQTAHGLNVTGVADVAMRQILFSADAMTFAYYEENRAIVYDERSEAVRAVQAKLKALGYFTDSVDGDYDYGTRKAVELFQQVHGLPIDDKLISVEMRKLLSEGECIPISVYYWTAPLEYGDRGEAVVKLQTRLTELGYFNDSINGRYGSATEDAVRHFQMANSLEVSGDADTKTREVMNSDKAVTKEEYDKGLLPDADEQRIKTIEKLIEVAESKLGCPYVHKTHGPDTFDCSGFTRYVFLQVGIKLSAASYNQGYLDQFGVSYKEKLFTYGELRRGDLLVFNTNDTDDDLSDHLGIYLGNGKFIHASSARGEVIISDLLQYGHFSWAFRLI